MSNHKLTSNLTLAFGNWLEVADELPDTSVDMVLCDLPYGLTHHYWDSIIPLEKLWESYYRVCKPDASIVLFAAQPFTTVLAASNIAALKDDFVWVKNKVTGHLNARRKPLRKHEHVLVFRRLGCGTYNPQMSTGHPPVHSFVKRFATSGDGTYGVERNRISGGGSRLRFPTSVLEFATVNNNDSQRIHPNQKPIALLEHLIRTYSDLGDTILDNTMGSGSTGLAAIRTGRNFIGIEKDRKYFDAAEEWLLSASCPEFPGWKQFDCIIPPANSQE